METPATNPRSGPDPAVKSDGAGGRPPTVPTLPAEVTAAPPSEHVGKYVRVAKLGSGGMGDVWKAWDTELARWVALKFLRGGDDAEFARFKREAQVAGRLAHPHIAAIYEVGEAQGRPYIAMQFVDGQTLKGFPRGDLRIVARLVRDAARALAYAHEQGVVHRDIKPENIMVIDRGRTPGGRRETDHHVFVMDFGLARAMEGHSDLSIAGTVVGTPGYMCPEQARGEAVDGRADVYSLGATLYTLLVELPPFEGANVLQVLHKVQELEPRRLRRIDPRIPADLETIVMKCLEKDRTRRYASSADLAEELTRWLSGEAIHAHPPSFTYLLRKSVRRHRLVVLPAAAILLLAAGLVVWTVRSTRERADLEARTRGLEAEARRVHARDEALKLIETARPTLDRAVRLTYDRTAPHDAILAQAAQARALVEQAAAKAPTLALAHHLIGAAHDLEGRDDLAEQAWRRALECEPGFAPARFRLGRLIMSRAVLGGAAASRGEEAARRPALNRLAAEAVELMEAARGGLDDAIEREFAEATLDMMRRDHPRVRERATAAIERFQGRHGEEDFHWLLGTALQEPREILAAWDRAVALRPRDPVFLFSRAMIRLSTGDFRGAIADLDEALRARPRYADGYVNRGNARYRLGDLDEALADYGRALELAPDLAHVHTSLALVHFARRDHERALAETDEALRLDPRDADARIVRGNVRSAAGDPRRALEEFTAAIEIDEHRAMAWFNRGNARMDLGEFGEAVGDYDRAVRIDARYYQAFANRGAAKDASGSARAAADDYRRALELAPQDWPARVKLRDRLKQIGE